MVEHDELRSLSDADAIVFRLPAPPWAWETYEGKPKLTERDSASYRDQLAHWSRELVYAVDDGKTVFIELREPRKVVIYTGEREVTGAGRSRSTTSYVREVSNYETLPMELPDLTGGSGSRMNLSAAGTFLSRYWKAFANQSGYAVRFKPNDQWRTLVTAANSELAVGALATKTRGKLILIPTLELQDPDPEDDDPSQEVAYDEYDWTADGRARSFTLFDCLAEIHANFRAQGPEALPGWLNSSTYESPTLSRLNGELAEIEAKLAEFELRRDALGAAILDARRLQALLYGTGASLESAIRVALDLMGFRASPFHAGDSEFDVVFEADGARLLGEAEGRDNRAIDVDKIRQLETNIAEDFERDEVAEHARGVLFGNPQRLLPPAERTLDFTDKCKSSARRSGYALVLTHNMFAPAAYLQARRDEEYAGACRAAIQNGGGGIVNFPPVPQATADAGCVAGD